MYVFININSPYGMDIKILIIIPFHCFIQFQSNFFITCYYIDNPHLRFLVILL